MPVIIPKSLPATITLEKEAVFVMNEFRASSQDIRPLKLVIVNLMPKKIETETQLLRLLSNNPLQIEIDLIAPKTHESKNTPKEHLLKLYRDRLPMNPTGYPGWPRCSRRRAWS